MLCLTFALSFFVPASGEIPWDVAGAKIPIEYNAAKKDQIRQLELHVSADRGATWTRHSVAQPGEPFFEFTATRDGPYWFVLVIEDVKGGREPRDVSKADPGAKLFVRVANKG